ncbi:hypothetical protein N8I77_012709 [Diaporthe amygdali]|uniref:Small ribosomal subunit protein uS5 n=1 Tax=Phomopsis amygdali TaxID=1214568 RepID=A0AAD9S1H4_PHOAM|nr:hypothetical protein N8I77_012709 [Diaporthe amygdali]
MADEAVPVAVVSATVVAAIVDVVVVAAVDVVEARARRRSGSPSPSWAGLVKAGKIKSMEEIYLHSLPIKEYQIVDFFLPKLKDEVMKIKPVQKQTRAGQRTRFKAIVIIGDSEGHVGLGIKTSKEVATAIRAANHHRQAERHPPCEEGYWGANLGQPTPSPSRSLESVALSPSVPLTASANTPTTHSCARGTSLVASQRQASPPACWYRGCLTSSSGSTQTLENTLKATFAASKHLRIPDAQPVEEGDEVIRSPLE